MSVHCINWSKVKIEKVDADKWNTTVNMLQNEFKMTRLPNREDGRRYTELGKLVKHYFVVQRRNSWLLHYLDMDDAHILELCPNTEDDNPYTGSDAMMALSSKFKELTGRSFYSEFTTYNENLELRKELKQCVPAPVNWARAPMVGNVFYADNFFKNDISSAYPAMASMKLPKLKEFKKVAGRVEPTKEYPFAFYLNSRTMAVLDEFDSRTWENNPFYMVSSNPLQPTVNYIYQPNYNVRPQDETTLLLKQSSYSLADTMKYFYNLRKEKPEYKFFMNAFLGFLHREANPEFPHIAAVVLGRCVNFILEKADYLRNNNQFVCLIATDSIGWSGTAVPEITDTKKQLGAFISEYKDAEFCCKGPKCYQIKADEITKTVWAGVSKKETANLKFGEIATASFKRKIFKLNDDATIRSEFLDV